MQIQVIYILTFLFIFSQVSQADVFTLPIRKHQKKMLNKEKNSNFLNLNSISELPVSGLDNNSVYTVEVQVGKSEKTFNILLDTGSQVFWVTSNTCDECKNYYKNRYDCQESDGCVIDPNQENVKPLVFGDGTTIDGKLGKTQMKVGEFQIDQQPFILGDKAVNVTSGGEDGILGLGLNDEFGPQNKNWISYLFSQKKIPQESFSLYYDFEDKSSFGIGGYNTQLIKESSSIAYHPVTSQDEWKINISTFSFGSAKGSNVEALIDSGTSAISLTSKFYEDILDLLQNEYSVDVQKDQLKINCGKVDQLPDFEFNMLDSDNRVVKYTIPSNFYVMQEGNNCYLIISADKDSDSFILGDVFFRRYLTVFEYNPNRIGLAESISQAPIINTDGSDNSLPGYAIFLIVFGCILVVAALIFLVIKLKNKKKQKNSEVIQSTVSNDIKESLTN